MVIVAVMVQIIIRSVIEFSIKRFSVIKIKIIFLLLYLVNKFKKIKLRYSIKS